MSIDTTPFDFDPAGLSEGIERAEDNSPYANLDPELRTEAEAGALATLFGVLAASAATAELEEQGKTDNVYAKLAQLSLDFSGEVADLMVDENVDPEVDAHFMVAVGKVVGASLEALRTALEN